MIITATTVGAFAENAYLVVDEASRRAVYVDPGAEGDRLVATVRRAGVELDAIWLTHAHVDHVGGIAALRRAFGNVPIHLHALDRPLYDASAIVAELYGFEGFDVPPPPDRTLDEGDVLTLGASRFTVAHVPGHAPGHVLFVGDDVIFGGDLLFAGSVGRTDLPYCDPKAMTRSLERAASLPEHLVVHPGHGPSTTIGAELRANPFLTGAARPVGRL